jgi:hypothetical protein
MNKIIVFITLPLFFLTSCYSSNSTRTIYPSIGQATQEFNIYVELYPTGYDYNYCKATLTLVNKTSKSFSRVYSEITIYDSNKVNVDYTNYLVSIGPNETLKREKIFYKYNCYLIKDLKLTKFTY